MSQCKSIMIQGTCSNAGKSLITAGLCRIFSNLGLKVAPFKSQNMALNSYVTENGEEIGRAQALQAMAARIDIDVRMNPILLKPTSEQGSQVIVMGKVIGNMKVAEYIKYKEQAWEKVTQAYDSLASESDIIVIEGAGSPAEINLRQHDIVNMRMAHYANAPVLLVGDIDRGGVFASLVGTMELLSSEDKAQIAGFIINKFRGIQDLLHPALIYTSERTNKKFLGIVPHIANLNLPEEDSVNFKLNCKQNIFSNEHDLTDSNEHKIVIGLIDLPYISNFTDFDPFRNEPDVQIKIIHKVEDLRAVDIIIIPGSKNTCADLKYLHESGLAKAICTEAESGTAKIILGICAGLQILGMNICDPHHIEIKESDNAKVHGLSLLPIISVMAQEKILKRTNAIFFPNGINHKGEGKNKSVDNCKAEINCTAEINNDTGINYANGVNLAAGINCNGYEIHHGKSHCKAGFEDNLSVCMLDSDGQALGWKYVANSNEHSIKNDNYCSIWGTYLHGLFENDIFRRSFIDNARMAKNMPPLNEHKVNNSNVYSLEPSLDLLAKVLFENLDMKAIYKLLDLSFR